MRGLNLFGHEFSSYWTMLFTGAALTVVLSILRGKRYNIGKFKSVIIALLVIIFGCLGAKLLYMIESPDSTFSLRGGMSLYGSVYLIPIAFVIFAPLLKVKYAHCMDFVALYGPLIFAFMRIGCYLNGCCGGIDIDFLPPVQLIECFFDIAIFLFLLYYEHKENGSNIGVHYPMFMVSYATMRFVVEFLRDTPKNIFYLSEGQWISILTLVLGAGILYFKNKKCRKEEQQ